MPGLRTSASGLNHTPGTSQGITISPVADGDIVIVVLTLGANAGLNNSPITPPTGYTQFASASGNNSSGTVAESWAFWHLWKTGDPTFETFSWVNAGSPTWAFSSWYSCNTVLPIDSVATGSDAGARTTSIVMPSLTLPSLNDSVLIFAFVESSFGSSFSGIPPTGFTTQQVQDGDGNANNLYFATMNTPSSPTGAQTITSSTALFFSAISVALTPASFVAGDDSQQITVIQQADNVISIW